MGHVDELETRRERLQDQLCGAHSQAARNRLGQFATPRSLAEDIIRSAVSHIPIDKRIRFLEPGFGTGPFYSALLSQVGYERTAAAQGYEIDSHYCAPAAELWRHTPLELDCADFAVVRAPDSEAERFDLVVCNPPYVRHQHLSREQKVLLQRAASCSSGVTIGGLAGLYCYFLGIAHSWMKEGGVAAWLVPSEFMDVNYGRAVKTYLTQKVKLIRIHRFDPSDVQFPDALVSSVVVFFRKEHPDPDDAVLLTFGGSITTPAKTYEVPFPRLDPAAKWTGLTRCAGHEGPTLSDYFKIKRGIATGSNHFFILSKEQIDARGLPAECFRPILPGPRHLADDVVRAGEDGTPALIPQMYVLDCSLPPAVVREAHPALWEYLQEGVKRGIPEGYLCRHRKPWYAQEQRPAAAFLCTYIGRRNGKRGKPFRFILNYSVATAPNVYLMLYPKSQLAGALADDPEMTVEVWRALSEICPDELVEQGRVYGGGLHKMEPKELGNVPALLLANTLERGIRQARLPYGSSNSVSLAGGTYAGKQLTPESGG